MRFRLDPFSPSGVSVAVEPPVTQRQSNGYVVNPLPSGGVTNQVLQKSASGVAWGVALTVSATAPTSPALNDLWVDTT